jgi:hypothetical protein
MELFITVVALIMLHTLESLFWFMVYIGIPCWFIGKLNEA